ncbi:MAG: cupin domain-containing protein [Candidatus Omnitrophica bacterium]|nr:cupin domain-containing protein [Candidatus Omnitrophota bacterium]HOX54130.1 cupin domain-containing protein [Candidatus Omnitrophota bacterium]
MSEIQVQKLDKNKMKQLNIPETAKNTGVWSVWECEPSTFDWQYSDQEICYIYEGKVTVKTPKGDTRFQAGDLVIFPKGLKCQWQVHDKVRKVYKFE